MKEEPWREEKWHLFVAYRHVLVKIVVDENCSPIRIGSENGVGRNSDSEKSQFGQIKP